MDRLLGIETEYGIFIEGVEIAELADEARALVQSYPGTGPWDYSDEDPLRDARGGRAPALSVNPEDARYEKPTHRMLSASEDHADRVLGNGARFYHDHGHPEYSTPECRSLRGLIAHDKAGERIVWEAAQAYAQRTGRAVSIFKNNIDYHGMSYGCHENYLVQRKLPFERLIAGLTPFLVTRILFAGAGRVGSESDPKIDFQLSQRADFFTELCSVDTLHRRPLINTRDEPHADAKHYRRLHVICGDANLNEYATALKIGTTALVLGMLELGYGPPGRLKQPVETLQKLSRDANRRWIVELEGEGTISALELQRLYLRAAQELFLGRDEETNWVLREWESILDDLERDPTRCADRVDWAAKYQLLQQFVESERLTWQDEILRSLDLEYHNLDPQRGLFYELQRQGCCRRIVSDSEIEQARKSPPKETRAWVRGLCVQKFSDSILALNWGKIHLRDGEGELTIDLTRWVDGRLNALALESIEAASTPRALWRMIKQL
ncbi:MAG: proteasome accessory factor PafA2 family protein [Candidatus Bipolaricaulota bacterium]|nr:proteasome accessory factor PafA2 family protein [Candidatus Bipolaricaulota bacterium]MCS7274138.1 proteasome accessory factor PafA2 family protein [Candidatus Bipolaricaulota bacterium]MDW8111311.1 proteasome accessory factor PafA2 family protein [Candidatus Bipolaricaulota bacterium]MDW8328553.1 proteasome accessory factor PafA2 family protein [Candidatus Bipolaricaulota bacterium]